MSGKGSAPRPFSVPREEYDKEHERIFGKRCIRHPSVRLSENGTCPRCMEIWERFNNKQGEWKPVEWGK